MRGLDLYEPNFYLSYWEGDAQIKYIFYWIRKIRVGFISVRIVVLEMVAVVGRFNFI